jgi:hypothetical protein
VTGAGQDAHAKLAKKGEELRIGRASLRMKRLPADMALVPSLKELLASW